MGAPLAAALLAVALGAPGGSAAAPRPPVAGDPTWSVPDPEGRPRVRLHFFWSEHCPHCHRARAFLRELAPASPWLVVESYELTESAEARAHYAKLAERLGARPQYVPAFAFCGRLEVGFAGDAESGTRLREALRACRDRLRGAADAPPPPGPSLPGLGRVDPQTVSLPLVTVLIAGLDAFNPCAFFVLLFLLSLLVHARSRARILLVGGVFVVFSGLVYFLFMAAWLNAFLLLSGLEVVTAAAGAVAVLVGLLNAKDFFLAGRGPSLAIPERARPGLYRRVRELVVASRGPGLLLGAVLLALFANTYELLCTAGFPMVYTRILTLRELPTSSYYLYLALYNTVYVLPLAVVVGVFAWTLGSRKLREREGRILKLLSGLMMLGLGAVILVAPTTLQSPLVAVGILGAAGLATALAVLVERARRSAA